MLPISCIIHTTAYADLSGEGGSYGKEAVNRGDGEVRGGEGGSNGKGEVDHVSINVIGSCGLQVSTVRHLTRD